MWSPTLVMVTVTLASPPPLAFTPHPSPHLPWASCGDLGLSRVCERLHAEHRKGRRLLKHLDRVLGLIKTECGKKKQSVIFMRFIAFWKWRNLWSISKRKCQVWQVHSVPPKNVKNKKCCGVFVHVFDNMRCREQLYSYSRFDLSSNKIRTN